MSEALNKVQADLIKRHGNGDQTKAPLNGLWGYQFEQTVRVRFRDVEHLFNIKAHLPEIEKALRQYLVIYRAQATQLRNFMTLSTKADDTPNARKIQKSGY